jgi:ribosomal protein S18 acetylase RimI-like enzyme
MARSAHINIKGRKSVHPLDNPVWSALTTRQRSFATGDELARRFPREIAPFAAFPAVSEASFDALAGLLASDEEIALVTLEPIDIPSRFEVTRSEPINQMLCTPVQSAAPRTQLTQLGPDDIDDMLALVDLTKPGPFGIRTRELGDYLGIRVDGQLVAMAGERMHVDGYTEVSAVCTHPLYRGRGFSRDLITAVSNGIVARGEVPFLHVFGDNASAIALYEKLGFSYRTTLHLSVFRHAG